MDDAMSRKIENDEPNNDQVTDELEEENHQEQQPETPADEIAVSEQSEQDEDPQATIETLRAEIARLEQALAEEHDRHLRAVAELQNYRKRVAREQQERARYASQDVLEQILPVMDNLQRVLEHEAEAGSEEFARGVRLVVEEFFRVLERLGVSVIECEGQQFDPMLHEAVAQVETEDAPAGTVVAVDTPGYRLHDRCLRPARVVVATGPREAEDEA